MYEGIIREAASDRKKWIKHESDETKPEEEIITAETKNKRLYPSKLN